MTSLPAVTLKPRRARPFFGHHPWVFAGAIASVEESAAPGDEVRLLSEKGEFIARGLYNPHSNIRVRLYTWDEEESLDEGFLSTRLDRAIALRQRIVPMTENLTARRLVASEGDGLSGLTVDEYDRFLVVQVTSLALGMRLETIVELLQEKLSVKGLWLRTEKGILEAEGLELSDGPLAGASPPRPLFVVENGIRYGVDLTEGQKTGFFLDQRDNRLAAARYVDGKDVLDAFCYSGGFGLGAVIHGNARSVHALDVSESALTLARNNAELNGVAQKLRFEKSDAFEALERLHGEGRRFGAVILDPPKMARHRKGLDRALRGYRRLNRAALELLEPDGILVTCSCSGHVDTGAFEAMLAESAIEAKRELQILEARSQAPDHPVSIHCLEGRYLKCYICRVV